MFTNINGFVLFRATLNMEVTKDVFRLSNIDTPKMISLVPYREAGGGFFFSYGNSIYNWSYTLHNHTLGLENNGDITSFHHTSNDKLIVSDGHLVSLYRQMSANETFTLIKRLVCYKPETDNIGLNNCAQISFSELGPTAIDYSNPDILYYAAGSAVRKFNISVPNSNPNMTTQLKFVDASLGVVTAITLSEDSSHLFTIQNNNSMQTVRSYDLASQEMTTTVQLIETQDQILQAVYLDNGALLCRSNGGTLLLLNTYTGHLSTVVKGTTYLPCDSSECGQNPIKVRYLTNLQGQGVHLLYGVDETQKPIALHCNSEY